MHKVLCWQDTSMLDLLIMHVHVPLYSPMLDMMRHVILLHSNVGMGVVSFYQISYSFLMSTYIVLL